MFLNSTASVLTENSATPIAPLGAWFATYDSTYGFRVFKYTLSAESSTALVAGGACSQKPTAAKASGYSIIQPVTGYLGLYGGVVMAARTAAYYGWVQILGWHTDAYVYGHANSAVGSFWAPFNAVNYLVHLSTNDAGTIYPRHALACEAYTTTTASAAKDVYVMALW